MNETQEYLNKYQSLCMEQLEYLSRRMYQRRAMDEEIEDLFKRAKWNYAYVCSILEGKQPPAIMESDPNNIGPSHPPAPPAPRRGPTGPPGYTGRRAAADYVLPPPGGPPSRTGRCGVPRGR